MTQAQRKAFTRLVLASMFVLVVLIIAVFMQSYYGRADLVRAQRIGCERGKLDRRANELGWRTAEAARRASGTRDDLRAAGRYAHIAQALHQRSLIDCAKAYPNPSPVEGLWGN